MPLDVNDPAFMPLYERQKRALEEAFEAGLKLHGCVECARVDLAQRLRLMARAAEQEIIGQSRLGPRCRGPSFSRAARAVFVGSLAAPCAQSRETPARAASSATMRPTHRRRGHDRVHRSSCMLPTMTTPPSD